jgi:hypothetical protein
MNQPEKYVCRGSFAKEQFEKLSAKHEATDFVYDFLNQSTNNKMMVTT